MKPLALLTVGSLNYYRLIDFPRLLDSPTSAGLESSSMKSNSLQRFRVQTSDLDRVHGLSSLLATYVTLKPSSLDLLRIPIETCTALSDFQ
jgi:hypothetical protein